MNGLARLKKLEKIHADKIDPVFRILIVDNQEPLEYMVMSPCTFINGRALTMNEEEYSEWKEKKERDGKRVFEFHITV